MAVWLDTSGNVVSTLETIVKAGEKPFSTARNIQARTTSHGILKDGTDLWEYWLDSSDMLLYGGKNEDGRFRFKIDHNFDLNKIIKGDVRTDGSISLNSADYGASKGKEFIVIKHNEIKEADCDYAIRADKYKTLKQQNKLNNLTKEFLQKEEGVSKINTKLTKDEVLNSALWLELAVGKSRNYQKAHELLKEYISEAEMQKCFSNRKGMGFYIENNVDEYKVRPLCVWSRDNDSNADDGDDFHNNGRFLRVSEGSGAAATKNKATKAKPEVTGDDVVKYMKKHPNDTMLAKISLAYANAFYQKK